MVNRITRIKHRRYNQVWSTIIKMTSRSFLKTEGSTWLKVSVEGSWVRMMMWLRRSLGSLEDRSKWCIQIKWGVLIDLSLRLNLKTEAICQTMIKQCKNMMKMKIKRHLVELRKMIERIEAFEVVLKIKVNDDENLEI